MINYIDLNQTIKGLIMLMEDIKFKPSRLQEVFFHMLKEKFPDHLIIEKFRFDNYMVDFAFPNEKIAIDIDNLISLQGNNLQEELDKVSFFESKGFIFIRFDENEIITNPGEIINELNYYINRNKKDIAQQPLI